MDEIQDRIDEACDAYRAHIAAFLRDGPVMPSINDFPNDVLRGILRFAVKGKLANNLIVLSQTCSLWRKIILGDQQMWSYLDLGRTRPVHTRLFIERSEKPLDIEMHSKALSRFRKHGGPMTPDGDALSPDFHTDFLERYLGRTRSLGIYLNEKVDFRFPSGAADQMVHFFVRGPHRPLSAKYDLFLPSDIFPLHPKLRSIVLANIRFDYSSSLFSGLTQLTLKLYNSGVDRDDHILDVLRNSPHLENVAIQCVSALVNPQSSERNPIPLLSLRELDLALRSDDINMILESIQTPQSATILLRFFTSDSDLAPSAINFPSDPRCLPGLSSAKGLTVDMTKKILYAESLKTYVEVSPHSSNKGGHVHEVLYETFERLRSQVSFPFLERLQYFDNEDSRTDPRALCLLLTHLSSLKHLEIAHCSPDVFQRIRIHTSFSITPFCPALETIVFHSMTIDADTIVMFEAIKDSLNVGLIQLHDIIVEAETKEMAISILNGVRMVFSCLSLVNIFFSPSGTIEDCTLIENKYLIHICS